MLPLSSISPASLICESRMPSVSRAANVAKKIMAVINPARRKRKQREQPLAHPQPEDVVLTSRSPVSKGEKRKQKQENAPKRRRWTAEEKREAKRRKMETTTDAPHEQEAAEEEEPQLLSSFKIRLNEHCQRFGLDLPAYSIAGTDGPVHAQTFRATASVADERFTGGWYSTLKAAQGSAAEEALRSLAPERRPLLVLLDLNGTLVHRQSSTAPFAVRPGCLALLRALARHVDIGFCTSMQPKNAKRALRALIEACDSRQKRRQAAAVGSAAKSAAAPADEPALPSGSQGHARDGAMPDASLQRLLELSLRSSLFAGDEYHYRNDVGVPLLPLRVPGLEPWRLLRKLSLIWSDPRAKGHTDTSTVLVDDTPGKCPLSPGNVLIVGSWEGELEREACRQSKHTLHLLARHLVAASTAQAKDGEAADVRSWLAAHPFSDALRLGASSI